MSVIIGSARIGENGSITGGSVGDQKQTSKPDYKGEVSMQEFYVHSKGWNVLRLKRDDYAKAVAANMEYACNNKNLGYDQNNRYGVIHKGTHTTTKTECDCSSLVRACVMEATGKDPGDFATSSEADALEDTGLFERRKRYTSGMKLYEGDVLVTCTRGHTVIVVEGADRGSSSAKVPDKLNKSAKWRGKVTASELNVRTWPGKENKTCSFSPLKKDANVYVCDKAKAANGDSWYYIKYNGKYGFVAAKYIAKIL